MRETLRASPGHRAGRRERMSLATRYPHTPAGLQIARRDHFENGGWLIDHGDCCWVTGDEGTAVDLLLPLLQEDRSAAVRVARAAAIVERRVVVINAATARTLAAE